MEIPSTAAQAIGVFVVVLPGIVFATTRSRLRGLTLPDVSLSSRITQGVLAGAMFDAVYLLIFGSGLLDVFTLESGRLVSVRAAACVTLVLGIVVPAGVAVVFYASGGWLASARAVLARWMAKLGVPVRYNPTPTAWDMALPGQGESFVRIRTTAGEVIGGWFQSGLSHFSTYPETHDIFIAQQYEMGDDGVFVGPIEGASGLWYQVQPGDIVEWIRTDEAS